MRKQLLFFLLLFLGIFMYASKVENSMSSLFTSTKEFLSHIGSLGDKESVNSGIIEYNNLAEQELKTLLAACNVQTLPFKEGFNQSSTTFSCWTIVDGNNDSTSPTGTNIWRQSNLSPQEGDRTMQFSGSGTGKKHDDWLISPTLKMSGAIYAITFYIKTIASYNNELEILMSTTGTSVADFTTTIQEKTSYNNADYVKKVVYVQGTTADANIAWRVVSTGSTMIYIDNISVEKVDCIAPNDEIAISGLEKDKLTVTIVDTLNSSWEYFVQLPAGPEPVGSGTVSNSKTMAINRINGGGNLQPNTEYEIYIKSSCGQGKTSKWIGPYLFRTLCDDMVLPFWEGFNKVSTNLNCWTFFDGNKDSTGPTSSNIWKLQTSALAYEGDQHAYFFGSGTGKVHDDWLISPNFNFLPNKIYRLKYHYKTTASNDNEFEVLASNAGIDPVKFTKVVVGKKTYKNDTYLEEVAFISGLSGKVNIAWHVVSTGTTTVYIDNVFVEEVLDCPEPIKIDATNIGIDKATLTWVDEFQATDWEYVVQVPGTGMPLAKGTATKTKTNPITKDSAGKNLEANTEYEVYVRTVCGNGKYSIWSGPFSFKTNCSIFTTPFWEGFNVNSKTLRCWTVLNNNNDLYSWKTSTSNYEGGQSMYFYGYGTGNFVHDDWLVSPVITFAANKIYRLKYHYRASEYDNEFEVLLSNSGMAIANFTKVVVAKDKYRNGGFLEEITFISGVSGDINLAFHVTTKGISYLYIDNVFIEEVVGCPEPLKLEVSKVEKDKATLSWTESTVFNGTGWEYVVQKAGEGIPLAAGTHTTVKENAITKDQLGQNLLPNTEYEFYVRAVCGGGDFSIWSGPVKFFTSCDVYQIPFEEGFNTDSKTLRCWTIVDVNKDGNAPTQNMWGTTTDGSYEGDQAMKYFGLSSRSDDWLISPMLELDGGSYVLKYYYLTDSEPVFNNEFEVMLSTEGVAVDKFKQTLVARKKYLNKAWVEEVVFINNIQGVVNIGWHAVSSTGIRTLVSIDKMSIKKIIGCPEPYYVKTTAVTNNSIDIEWQQDGGITNWEVEIVGYGSQPTGLAANIKKVTGNPKTTLIGLSEGKAYSVFVRAVCSDNVTTSDWSTPLNTAIKVGLNDECSGALTIPVNSGLECEKTISATFSGANISKISEPFCHATGVKTDVWFEFTATSTQHMLKMTDIYSNQESNGSSSSTMYIAIYDQDCATIVNTAISCFSFNNMGRDGIIMGLVPGKKYLLRVATTVKNPDFIFSLCITTSQFSSLEVSPSGDKYSVEELVKDVLIKSNCDLVSNIKYQAGDNSAINTLGYFNKATADFPFEEGIVLATHAVKYTPGPHHYVPSKDKVPKWTGDADLNEVIKQVGGVGFGDDKYVSVLEFDFIPIKDSLNFEYLFASESYDRGCTYVCKEGGALFAAWLTEIATGEGQNLALVPGTTEPIALSTIRDSNKSGAACRSMNPTFFSKYYDNIQDSKLDAPVNYVGLTVPMSSEKIPVKAGKKYRIKLAVADFCPNVLHTSAVFFNAASFDLGSVDLGVDMLVETNNALCDGESKTIKSGLSSDPAAVDIRWFRDEVLIPNEKGPDLEVTVSGTYKIMAKYLEVNCETSGSVKVEIFPAISKVLAKPEILTICRTSLKDLEIDLTQVEKRMLGTADPMRYAFTYFETKAAAEIGENAVANPKAYVVKVTAFDVKVYQLVEDLYTGCTEIFEITLKSTAGSMPAAREDVKVCATYTFPALESNQAYYTLAAAQGDQYKPGDVLDSAGLYKIYVFQDNGAGCYEETAYHIAITEAVKADVFADLNLKCEFHELKALSEHNRYFTQSGGRGTELAVGTIILDTQRIYVYASSPDGLCIDESSFEVRFEECPIPKGISPNGDGFNDAFDLSKHGATSVVIYNRYGTEVFSYQGVYTNQWVGQNKSGKLLPDGTYYYVVIAHGKTRTGWVQINK
ncbi:choice-of-anchor J domain-containing protein [Flavobacterium sp. HSC-61S13]|uniref:choice-of-anchor J domain-containing protein n=1 Tax=Flavobacterium sp. HSC-61S13 TaxID=2910963 RepID=UPI0020A19A47|nr:choice-of-anchor J domain-containing protein [Flavobacterium sp. HSC-61S13]MCP1995113.1 gliding motility-associated-like protein [Flavobacterium sp. HSC-61S13]